jgi:hypothetical protein
MEKNIAFTAIGLLKLFKWLNEGEDGMKKKEKLPLLLDEPVNGVYPFQHKRSVDVRDTFKKYGWIPPSEKLKSS